MTWMFEDKDEIVLPMQATLLMKNLEFIKFEFNGQRHLGRSLIALISLALLILCQAQAADTGVPPQADDPGTNWDAPFGAPIYLLHSIGYLGPSGISEKRDLWFLCKRKPENNILEITDGLVLYKLTIDETLGPYNTRREVCAGAKGATGDSQIIWTSISDKGEISFVLANPIICNDNACEDKSSENLVLVPGSYPPDNCQYVCEDGYGMNEKLKCEECGAICRSKKNNEIAEAAECVGGKCKCICDLENGYYYNEQGVCVNDFESTKDDLEKMLINALKSKDLDAAKRALIPYLKNKNENIRLMAIMGLKQCFVRDERGFIELPEDIRNALLDSISKDRGLWRTVSPNQGGKR